MNKKAEFRTERDRLGELPIPASAYWGIASARSNFALSGVKTHPRLIEAITLIKKTAAQVNLESSRLGHIAGKAIIQAADEVLNGQWREHFVVDAYVAGGKALNDNVNEVLANRAAEILGEVPGTSTLVHPGLVNLAQSPNDVYPTAMRLSALASLKELQPILLDLERLLRRKSLEFERHLKIGRPHLQDSYPVTLGQEFNAYGSSIERSYRRITEAGNSLLEMNIGSTAVGTGVNSDSSFVAQMVQKLGQISGLHLRAAEDHFRLCQSLSDFQEFSSSLKELAVELVKIANDLRLLGSGPVSGLGEIQIPPVQSTRLSQLPAALADPINPVLPESVNMVAFQVIGNDTAVTFAAQAGQLELNVMMPLVIHNILSSMDLLKNTLNVFNQKCVAQIRANNSRCQELLERSGVLGLFLSQQLGKEKASQLVTECLTSGKTIKQLVLEQDLIAPDTLEKLLNYKLLTQPGFLSATTDDTA